MSEELSQVAMQQIESIVRRAIREEFADAGLRVDDQSQQDEAREDFRFVRKLRKLWDATASKTGNTVLIAALFVVGAIISLGFWSWINGGGK